MTATAPALPIITSDGRTGADFIRTMARKRCILSLQASDVLCKKPFDVFVTSGVMYETVVILGSEFSDSERITANVRKEANRRKYVIPPAELAPLLREKLGDEELKAMGLYWLVVMHEPIMDSGGRATQLLLSRDGDRRLTVDFDADSDRGWPREIGFAFLAPEGS